MIFYQMSLGQFASSIFGAVCYSQEQTVSATLLVPPQGVSSLVRRVGFTFVSTRFSLTYVTYTRMQLWGPINIACDLTITICMVTFVSGIFVIAGNLSQTMILTASQTSQENNEAPDTFAYHKDCTNCHRNRNGNK
jgi:hypothetical protein